ncbi:MAG: hypothetical protein OXF01_17970 [Gemmatimonadetes bacterium]|nr:hypothetical protein [Gemmatimonadota bacterium]
MDSLSRERGKKVVKTISDIVSVGGKVHAPIFALLAWFGCEKRGVKIVGGISSALQEYGLKTIPDFADVQRHDKFTTVEFQKVPRKYPPSPKKETL